MRKNSKKRFMQASGVYKMMNTITNHTYIGSSKNISKRIGRHRYTLKNSIYDNIRIKEDALKHGASSFEFEVLEYCKESERLEREQYYFKKLAPYYNVWPSVYSARNRNYTEEQLNSFQGRPHILRDRNAFSEKLKKAWVSRKKTDEWKNTLQKLSQSRPFTEEAKKKMSRIHKGKKLSDKTKEKIRRSRLGSKWDHKNKTWINKDV